MEKIYQNNKQKQEFFKNQGSTFLSVILGIIAIIGLVAFGFNQISFAADEIILKARNGEEIIGVTNVNGGDIRFNLYELVDENQGGFFEVFCTQYMMEFVPGKEYNGTNADPINEDPGLAYLISKLDEVITSDDDRVFRWLGQSAVWTYMYEYEDLSVLNLNVERANHYKNIYENAKKVHTLYDSSGAVLLTVDSSLYSTLYDQYHINDLILKARQKRTNGIFASVHKTNDNISMVDNNMYYSTSVVSLNFTDSDFFERYSLDISKAPKGTILVDASGQVYEKDSSTGTIIISAIAPKFYVRVPVENVTNENKKFDISVAAEYSFPGVSAYIAEESQTVVTTGINAIMQGIKEVGFTVDLDYTPTVPDTGENVTKTIYFMGLIILLSGIGVVYATVKPKKN